MNLVVVVKGVGEVGGKLSQEPSLEKGSRGSFGAGLALEMVRSVG